MDELLGALVDGWWLPQSLTPKPWIHPISWVLSWWFYHTRGLDTGVRGVQGFKVWGVRGGGSSLQIRVVNATP